MDKDNKRLTLRLKSNLNDKLEEISKKNKISKNELINFILSSSLDKVEDELLDFNYFSSNDEHKFVVFLSTKEKEYLEKYAIEHGFNFVTSEIRYRLYNTIYNDKFYTNIELSALSKIANDLNKLGRNIVKLLENAMKTNRYTFELNYDKFSEDLKEIRKILYDFESEVFNIRARVSKRI